MKSPLSVDLFNGKRRFSPTSSDCNAPFNCVQGRWAEASKLRLDQGRVSSTTVNSDPLFLHLESHPSARCVRSTLLQRARAMGIIESIFGQGSELTIWQMSARAAIVFSIALLLIRVSGRRSFGLHSPFDSCTTVLLGAILSRAVSGASPFVPTLAAATMLVVMHRLAGIAAQRWRWFDWIASGNEIVLVQQGHTDDRAMRKALVTDRDLQEAIRKKTGHEDVGRIERAVLERNGEITVVPE